MTDGFTSASTVVAVMPTMPMIEHIRIIMLMAALMWPIREGGGVAPQIALSVYVLVALVKKRLIRDIRPFIGNFISPFRGELF